MFIYFLCHFQVRNFGSISYSEHSMPVTLSRNNNTGKGLGFVKLSECCVGGEIIAIPRILHLTPILQVLVSTQDILYLKKHQTIVMVLSMEQVWDFLFSITKVFYPIMCIVPLADMRATAWT